MSATQTALAISEQSWPVALLLTVLWALRISVVSTAAWILLLKLIGVSKAERRWVGIASARRHLGLSDPPCHDDQFAKYT